MKDISNFFVNVVVAILFMYLAVNLLILNIWRILTFKPLYTMRDMVEAFHTDVQHIIGKDD